MVAAAAAAGKQAGYHPRLTRCAASDLGSASQAAVGGPGWLHRVAVPAPGTAGSRRRHPGLAAGQRRAAPRWADRAAGREGEGHTLSFI